LTIGCNVCTVSKMVQRCGFHWPILPYSKWILQNSMDHSIIFFQSHSCCCKAYLPCDKIYCTARTKSNMVVTMQGMNW